MSDGSSLASETAAAYVYQYIELVSCLCCYKRLTNNQL